MPTFHSINPIKFVRPTMHESTQQSQKDDVEEKNINVDSLDVETSTPNKNTSLSVRFFKSLIFLLFHLQLS